MTGIGWMWLVLGLLYAVFFAWYTSFGGPLTESEVAHYMNKIKQRGPAPSAEALAMLRSFMEEDTGERMRMRIGILTQLFIRGGK